MIKHGAGVLQRGLDHAWAGMASAGPDMLLDTARALPHVCLSRHEPGLCDSGQCPAGPGRSSV